MMRLKNIVACGPWPEMSWQKLMRLLIALGLLTGHGSLVTVHAAFEDTGTGARQTALNGASVAAADDVFSLMVNPAGLARVRRQEVGAEYSRLYMGLSDGSNLSQSYFGYARPVTWGGTLAAGWKQFSLSGLYSERTLSLGYGEWITSRVAAGLALKQLHHGFNSPNVSVDDSGNSQAVKPSFFSRYGESSNAYAMDLGFLIKATPRHTIGFAVQDVNEPNVALSSEDHEIVPRTVRLGMDYQMPRNLQLMAAVVRRENLSNRMENIWTGAAERSWKLSELRSLAARGSIATGPRQYREMDFGAGYRTGALTLDYTFQFNLGGITLGDTAGTHRFSLKYSFGPAMESFVRRSEDGTIRRGGRRVQRDTEIEQWLGTSPERAGDMSAGPSSETESRQTADMMEKTPPPTPRATHAKVPGPGIQVQVPAPAPKPSAIETAMSQVPVPPPERVIPMDRVEMLRGVVEMAKNYDAQVLARSAAEVRLATTDSAVSMAQGYLANWYGEVSDAMAITERLDPLVSEHQRLTYEGAAVNDRLAVRVVALETVFGPALTDRSWDLSRKKEQDYKAFADESQAAVRQMAVLGVSSDLRINFMGQTAQKMLEFEQALSAVEPVSPVKPVETIKPTETVKPVEPVVPVKSVLPVKPIKSVKPVRPVKPVQTGKTVQTAQTGQTGGVPAVYIVQEGDTLESLAKRFYGDHKKWREIYILNEDRLGRGGVLKVGQRLVMPQPKEKGAK